MEEPLHSFTSLFNQLGLPSKPEEIRQFIESHRPIPENISLPAAPFWNSSQSAFLLENFQDDADWSAVIDRLDVALREPRK